MARGRGLFEVAVGLVAAVGLVVVLFPLGMLVRTVWLGARDGLGPLLTTPGFGSALAHTFLLAAAVSGLSLALGSAFALALRNRAVPGRAFWRVALVLPVLVPDFVLGFSWLQAYGPAGFTQQVLGIAWPGVQGPLGVTVVTSANAVPLVYLIVTAGLAARGEPALEQAARSCGASAWAALRTVTLPLLRPTLATAAVLVFVLTLGSFAIPQVMGTPAGFATISTRIFADLAQSSDPAAFVEAVALALLLVGLTLAVVAPADVLLRGRLLVTRTAAAQLDPTPGSRRTGFASAGGIALYLLLTVALPLSALVFAAITRAVGLPPVPTNWTLANFRQIATLRNAEALARSVLLAALAASILAVLGACAAGGERTRAGRPIGTAVTLTLVLPGSTLAVGLLIAYGTVLGGTLAIIVLAYVAKLWAIAHRPLSGALDRLPPEELRAARVSGAPLPLGLVTVVLPPLARAVITGWGLCFLTGLHEVTMSSLLYGPGTETLAVVVLNSADLGELGVTAALAVAVTLLVLVPALVLWLLLARRGRSVSPEWAGSG